MTARPEACTHPDSTTEVARNGATMDRVRAEWAARDFSAALSEVANAIRPSKSRTAATHSPADDPLVKACRIVGRVQGISFVQASPLPIQGESLEQIAERLGFAFREVALGGDWYSRDVGPLVGWSIEGSPLALVRRRGHYRRTDPSLGGEQRVDATTAADISSRGLAIYRQFPANCATGPVLAPGVVAASKGQARTLIFAAVATALLALALPIASGILFGSTATATHASQLLVVTIGLLALIVGRAIYGGIISLTMVRLESRVEQALYASVWDRLLRLSPGFYRRYLIGDLYQRSQLPIELCRSGATIPPVLLAAIGSILSGVLMILLGGWAGVLCMAILLAVYGLAASIVYATRELETERRDAGARLAGFSIQLIQLIAKLKVGGAEDRAFANWARAFASVAKVTRQAEERLASASVIVGELPFLLGVAAFCSIVGRPGTMDLPKFVAFTVAIGQFSAATGSLFAKLETILNLHRLAARMRDLFAEPPEAQKQRRVASALTGRVEFDDVCFSYDADAGPLLKNISFVVEPGQMVAIVGPSGAGKSTLARLLLGFEKPSAGAILLDGCDLASLDLRGVRSQMGVVLQRSGLTGASIYLNIAAGTELDLDEAWAAAEAAGLAADIRAMPMGMNTRINENGSLLSGGQCQRLMLARAIARRPRILLLDEATSALDNEIQNIVARNLKELGMTRIVIAHRLTTVRDADNIFVLGDGMIVEQGCYYELMNLGGLFSRIAHRQIA